jgi:hypothetical protein
MVKFKFVNEVQDFPLGGLSKESEGIFFFNLSETNPDKIDRDLQKKGLLIRPTKVATMIR